MPTQFATRLSAPQRAGRRSVKAAVARPILAAALCLAVIGCSATTPTPANPSQAVPTPAQATDTQGSYRLVFELPRTDWRASDAITGEATLSLIGSGSADFGSSGSGPIAFAFEEIGGSRLVYGHGTPDCRSYRLEAGKPVSSPIKKSGGYSADAPPSDFNRWFMTDPVVHLPAGDWTITAIADVWAGICPVPSERPLRAAILVHVTA